MKKPADQEKPKNQAKSLLTRNGFDEYINNLSFAINKKLGVVIPNEKNAHYESKAQQHANICYNSLNNYWEKENNEREKLLSRSLKTGGKIGGFGLAGVGLTVGGAVTLREVLRSDKAIDSAHLLSDLKEDLTIRGIDEQHDNITAIVTTNPIVTISDEPSLGESVETVINKVTTDIVNRQSKASEAFSDAMEKLGAELKRKESAEARVKDLLEQRAKANEELADAWENYEKVTGDLSSSDLAKNEAYERFEKSGNIFNDKEKQYTDAKDDLAAVLRDYDSKKAAVSQAFQEEINANSGDALIINQVLNKDKVMADVPSNAVHAQELAEQKKIDEAIAQIENHSGSWADLGAGVGGGVALALGAGFMIASGYEVCKSIKGHAKKRETEEIIQYLKEDNEHIADLIKSLLTLYTVEMLREKNMNESKINKAVCRMFDSVVANLSKQELKIGEELPHRISDELLRRVSANDDYASQATEACLKVWLNALEQTLKKEKNLQAMDMMFKTLEAMLPEIEHATCSKANNKNDITNSLQASKNRHLLFSAQQHDESKFNHSREEAKYNSILEKR